MEAIRKGETFSTSIPKSSCPSDRHAGMARAVGAARSAFRCCAMASPSASSPLRGRNRPFAENQVQLLQTFADQAVIAIQCRGCSTRCRRRHAISQEFRSSRQTAEVLKIISRSSVDLETVLDTLVETVVRLCRADQAVMYRRRDDKYHLSRCAAFRRRQQEFILANPLRRPRHRSGRAVLERRRGPHPGCFGGPGIPIMEGEARRSAVHC